jgi:hypothetical protein
MVRNTVLNQSNSLSLSLSLSLALSRSLTTGVDQQLKMPTLHQAPTNSSETS